MLINIASRQLAVLLPIPLLLLLLLTLVVTGQYNRSDIFILLIMYIKLFYFNNDIYPRNQQISEIFS